MLKLLDRLAAGWLEWRSDTAMARMVKDNPDLVRFKKFECEPGKFNLLAESPAVVELAQQAAAWLNAEHAPNYIEVEMMPRIDRGLRPIRLTVAWANGESPAAKATRLENTAAQLRDENNALHAENGELKRRLADSMPM